MIYIIFCCAAKGVVYFTVNLIFVVFQVKDNALLQGGCGSFSGLGSRETR